MIWNKTQLFEGKKCVVQCIPDIVAMFIVAIRI